MSASSVITNVFVTTNLKLGFWLGTSWSAYIITVQTNGLFDGEMIQSQPLECEYSVLPTPAPTISGFTHTPSLAPTGAPTVPTMAPTPAPTFAGLNFCFFVFFCVCFVFVLFFCFKMCLGYMF